MASRGITCTAVIPRGESVLRADGVRATNGTSQVETMSPTFAGSESFGGVSSVSNTSFVPSPVRTSKNEIQRDVASGLLLGRLESNRFNVPDDLLPLDDMLPLDEEEALMEEEFSRGKQSEELSDELNGFDNSDDTAFANGQKSQPAPWVLSLRRTKSIQTRDDLSNGSGFAKTYLFPGASDESSDPLFMDHDEEIYLDGSSLIWSSGGVVRLKAQFPNGEKAKQALWCHFPEESCAFVKAERFKARCREGKNAVDGGNQQGADQGTDDDDVNSETSNKFCETFSWFRGVQDAPTLCVRLQRNLWTHTPGGVTRTSPLPRDTLGDFQPTKLGLLLRTRRGIFALRHPLDEPAPVVGSLRLNTHTRKLGNEKDCSSLDALASAKLPSVPSPTECIAWSSSDSVYVLTHDPTRMSHSLWRVAPATSATPNAADAPFDVADVDGDMDMDDANTMFGQTNPSERDSFEDKCFEDSQSTSPARVQVHRVWTEPKGFAERPTTFAAIANDDDWKSSQRLVVLGRDDVLRGYSLSSQADGSSSANDGSYPPLIAFTHANVKTAVPLKASRAPPLVDVLLVTREGMLLACGARTALNWRNDTPLFVEGENNTNVESINTLHSPVGARVTAEFTNGSTLRLTIPQEPVSPVTKIVLHAISAALDDSTLEPGLRQSAMEIVLSAAAEAVDPGEQWDRASQSLLAWCGCESLGRDKGMDKDTKTKPHDETDSDDDDSAWEYLLRSEMHLASKASYPSVSLAAGRSDDTGQQSTVKVATPTPHSERVAPRLSSVHAQRAISLLRAAHAAYESCKLDVLRHTCLFPLRTLCVRLATACAAQFSSANEISVAVAAEAVQVLDHHARDAWFEWSEEIKENDGCENGNGLDADDSILAARTLAKAGTWSASVEGGSSEAPCVFRALESIFSEDGQTETWKSLVPDLVLREIIEVSTSLSDTSGAMETGDESLRGMNSQRDMNSQSQTHPAGPAIRWAANVLSFALGAARASQASRTGDERAANRIAAATTVAMTNAGFGLTELDRVPSLLGLRLRDALRRCREKPPEKWPPQAYALVGRDDLATAAAARSEARDSDGVFSHTETTSGRSGTLSAAPLTVDARVRLVPGDTSIGDTEEGDTYDERGGTVDSDQGGGDGGNSTETAGDSGVATGDGTKNTAGLLDGMSHIEKHVGPLLFHKDRRLREVRQLLGSASPTPISLSNSLDQNGSDNGGDPEAVVAQQQKLWSLAPRTASLAVGRGAFTLGTNRCRPTETLQIPTLTLAGCLPQQRGAVVALDLTASGASGTEFQHWPEFHNGVASGLALAAKATGELTRSWILYNKPDTPSNAHAGVLLALGITGNLKQLTNTDLYRYLVQEHDLTTCAALLGTAAAYRGTSKQDIAKMCFLHIPAVHPSAFPEVEVSLNVQSAALVSVGLLYQKTAHRRTVEIVLSEIGADPDRNGGGGGNNTSDASAHSKGGREGYALCAGFALGVTCLGVGKSAIGLSDLRIVERLKRYLGGGDSSSGGMNNTSNGGSVGREASMNGYDNVSGTGNPKYYQSVDLLTSDITGGVDGWSAEDPEPWRLEDDSSYGVNVTGEGDAGDGDSNGANNATANTPTGGNTSQNSSGQVMQGSIVNVDATSPGAAVALGLMFLKTNDKTVAKLLNPPSTHYALDHVRPDFVLTRVCAKALILWDAIQPTTDWMESQLPALLRPPLTRITGSKYHDAKNKNTKIGHCFDAFEDDGTDREALAQSHVHALAGACMAVGLRYAGTANENAKAALTKMTLRFLSMKAAAATQEPISELVDRPTLETCICVSATAISCVMAGTGDVDTFRLLRRLRLRLGASGAQSSSAANNPGGAAAAATSATTGNGGVSGLSFGAHMAISTSIGFLFLGGGTMTFSTDSASIAALWLSIYPRYPQNASDNRCHLQAFRHLYPLASRRLLLETIDAASGVSVTAPVEMTVKGDKVADNNSNTSQKGTQTVTRLVTTPCLLPDPEHLVSLRVVGDRYWPIVVDSRNGKTSLQNLYATRKLPVQRLAGALPYASDPTGARAGSAVSLGVVHASSFLKPPRGNENESDKSFEERVAASDARRKRVLDTDADAVGDDSSTHGAVVGAFVSDPASVGFRRLLCAPPVEDGYGTCHGDTTTKISNSNHSSQTLAKTNLASFCRAALRECASREEPSATSAYVDAYANANAVRGAVDACKYVSRMGKQSQSSNIFHVLDDASNRIKRQIAVCDLTIGAAGVGGESDSIDLKVTQETRLMPHSLSHQFLECTLDALDAMKFDEPNKELCAYYKGEAFCAAVGSDNSSSEKPRDVRGLFGCFLKARGLPSAPAVRRALAKFGLGPPGSGLDPEAVVVALAVGLPGTKPEAVLRVAKCGL